MIYLDNAATTLMKPPEVAEAVARAIGSFGGVGRGVHEASIAAGMAVFDARERTARLLGAPSAARVAFAANATEALNIAIEGLLPDGGRAVTTAASHNSVLRPLFRARDERGCSVEVAPHGADGSLDFAALERLLAGGADLVAVAHASNLTGDVYDAALLARMAHEAGALIVLDAAQTAGALPVDMGALGADVVCFTGHKSLFGPQGTGGLAVAEGVEVSPLLEGGSGTHSFDERHPRFMPEALEAGTLNAHGLAGLAAGIAYLEGVGVDEVARQAAALVERFEAGALAVPGVRVLGGHGGIARCGIVALNVGGADSALVADRLVQDFGICVRAGAHCAPLMHRALGTEGQGAVRFSFSHFNTEYEVDQALEALEAVARDLA
ncbi:aminotransferase class V-fold PLP-dependent enzyme [Arabiibacter massiliensis]|uniref:aminotransferase class V-fold PLP-dependent enzyme n=1 Tax=Arabiibacter massiliensis TaxID=1870985 RepID=UPI0009B9D0E8|nr:aminotransferase class V-fold PLP-dependent enzyme [Arabiibacter massiliensis]